MLKILKITKNKPVKNKFPEFLVTLIPSCETSVASFIALVRVMLSRIEPRIPDMDKKPPAATSPMAKARISIGEL